MKSFWKPGGMGWMGTNTEGYIDEISQNFENCKMWDFNWKDMRVLMVINQLNSSDKEEARLAERLMESYNALKADKKALEMPEFRQIISSFWAEVKERR